MPEEIIIYFTDWCWDCRRALRFFDKQKIPYKKINIDKDPEGEQFVLRTNNGMRSVPTIVLPGGNILVEPSDRTLEEILAQSI
jgi:mycoredoxin